MGAALHLRIPPALKTSPRLTALLPVTITLLGEQTPQLSTGPNVTPCRVTTLLRAQARLYAEALSLYTPHNGTQVYTVAYRGAVESVVSIIAVA